MTSVKHLEIGQVFGSLRIIERKEDDFYRLECLCGNTLEHVSARTILQGRARTCSEGHHGPQLTPGYEIKTPHPPRGVGLESEILYYVGWCPEPACYQGNLYTRLSPYYRVRVAIFPHKFKGPEVLRDVCVSLPYLSDLQIYALSKAQWHPLEFFGDAIQHPPKGLRKSDAPPAYFRGPPKGGRMREDLRGRVFGHWKIIGKGDPPKTVYKGLYPHTIEARCVCGKVEHVLRSTMMALRSKGRGKISCGCVPLRLRLKSGMEYLPERQLKVKKKILEGAPYTLPERGFRVFEVLFNDPGYYLPYPPDQPQPSSKELVYDDLKGNPPRFKVKGFCVCGRLVECSLVEARGRASVRGCRCEHYTDMTPIHHHMYQAYLEIVLQDRSRDLHDDRDGYGIHYENALTDQGKEYLPSRILDRLELEGKVKTRSKGFKYQAGRPQEITGPDREWATFLGFCEAVPLPNNTDQTLIRLDKHKPWTASNVAWCYATKRTFQRVVPMEKVEEANRKGLVLDEESVTRPNGSHEIVFRLVRRRDF